jgi:tripartite-type tricarboxylate transporter receptor subunit TctC
LIAGRVDVMVDVVPGVAQLIRDGKLRALAVLVPTRSPQLPDVPTLAELGYRDFDISGWHALFAPRGVPDEVVTRLNVAANKFLARPEYQARLAALGAIVEGGTAGQLGSRMRRELHDWGEIIRKVGVTATAE